MKADGGEVETVLAKTGGRGAEAVIDFVGEGDAIAKGLAMTANDGYYYIVGYGGKIDIPDHRHDHDGKDDRRQSRRAPTPNWSN